MELLDLELLKRKETRRDTAVGSLIQIDPESDRRFGGCCLVVTEVKAWGVIGYVNVPEVPRATQAWYRLKWEHATLIGTTEWVVKE